ncbi:hypothetical protein [Kitasatospora phosalacinea]|uniref:hypothetical protein n=1 Tax=Kitasatospora phosalacinea TaxID=2065 RepID=UPI00131BF6DB|nr:hypothetical protein [Kitasatospora phosalacinea]
MFTPSGSTAVTALGNASLAASARSEQEHVLAEWREQQELASIFRDSPSVHPAGRFGW